VRLRNQWVPIDPRGWANRYDLTMSVGLGSGSKEQFLRGSAVLGQMMKDILASPYGRIVSEENVYNFARYTADAVAPKKADLFFTDPAKLGPPKPQVDPKIELGREKVAAQREKAKEQDTLQRDLKAVEFLTQVAGLAKQQPQEDRMPQFAHERDMQRMKLAHEAGMARDTREQAQMQTEAAAKVESTTGQLLQMMQQLVQAQGQLSQAVQQMAEVMASEKEPIYDEAGEVRGVRTILPPHLAHLQRQEQPVQ
jgi:hypothetical protein